MKEQIWVTEDKTHSLQSHQTLLSRCYVRVMSSPVKLVDPSLSLSLYLREEMELAFLVKLEKIIQQGSLATLPFSPL